MTIFAAGFFFLHLLRSKTQKRYVIFKKLSVRVIDITVEGGPREG